MLWVRKLKVVQKESSAAGVQEPTSARPELPASLIGRSGSLLGVLLIGQLLFVAMVWLAAGPSLVTWPVLAMWLLTVVVSLAGGLLVWLVERLVWTTFTAREVLLSYAVMAAVLVTAVLAIEFSLYSIFEPLFQRFNALEAVVAAVV